MNIKFESTEDVVNTLIENKGKLLKEVNNIVIQLYNHEANEYYLANTKKNFNQLQEYLTSEQLQWYVEGEFRKDWIDSNIMREAVHAKVCEKLNQEDRDANR